MNVPDIIYHYILDERGEYRRKRLYSKMNTLITKS